MRLFLGALRIFLELVGSICKSYTLTTLKGDPIHPGNAMDDL